jgi:hypothetical protein
MLLFRDYSKNLLVRSKSLGKEPEILEKKKTANDEVGIRKDGRKISFRAGTR